MRHFPRVYRLFHDILDIGCTEVVVGNSRSPVEEKESNTVGEVAVDF